MERFGNVTQADAVFEGHESAQRRQPEGGLSCHGFRPRFGAGHGPSGTGLFTPAPVETVETVEVFATAGGGEGSS